MTLFMLFICLDVFLFMFMYF